MGNLQNIQQGSYEPVQPGDDGPEHGRAVRSDDWRAYRARQQLGGSTNFNQSQGTNMGFSNGMNVGMGMNRQHSTQAPGSEHQQAAAQAAAGTSSRPASASQDKEIVMGGRS